MNTHIPIMTPDPLREAEHWARLRDEADAEEDALWERFISGEEQRERLAKMKAAVAMIDALPPKPEPTEAEIAAARQRTDDAMRELIAPLVKGHRQFNRDFGRE